MSLLNGCYSKNLIDTGKGKVELLPKIQTVPLHKIVRTTEQSIKLRLFLKYCGVKICHERLNIKTCRIDYLLVVFF